MMIDIHSHILMNVDDGAQSESDSLEMARQAVKEGITTIVATPHHKLRSYHNSKQTVVTGVARLNELLQKEQIPLTVLPGQEVRIDGDLLEDFQKGELLTVNDKGMYLLIEFSSSHIPAYAPRLFYELQLAGYIPVIVHPERNTVFLEQPNRLYEFVNHGALTQVTAGSIVGCFGKKIQKFSHQLIQANLTHFIASDAHNTTTRSFKLVEAFETIRTHYNDDTVSLLQHNAELLVQGKNILTEIPEKIQKPSFFSFFKNKSIFMKS